MGFVTLYHYPVCPFSQRVEILLALKGRSADVRLHAADITQPLPDWLLRKTRGSRSLPMLELEDGRMIKESLVIMQYLDDRFPERRIAQADPYRHAEEGMLSSMADDFCSQGYGFVMNQDRKRRDLLREGMLAQYARLNEFLMAHAPRGPFLFDQFAWAEAVFTPLFMRFWFLEYYEDFRLPDDSRFSRVRQWQDACVAHPAAQQVTKEEVVKLYYDYSKGAGNGSLLPGRRISSFAFKPHWRSRPWPPRNKYEHLASDDELGLNAGTA